MGEMLNGSGTGCGELVRHAVGTGSAGPCLRSQEGSGKGGFSRFARGEGLFAFNARSGTVPLPQGYLGVFGGQANPGNWVQAVGARLYWLRLGAGEPLV
jgi:hypothetical protein